MKLSRIRSRLSCPLPGWIIWALATVWLSGKGALASPLRLVQTDSEAFLLRVEFGHGPPVEQTWEGQVRVPGSQRLEVRGWQLAETDRANHGSFRIETLRSGRGPAPIKGLVVGGRASRGAILHIETNRGNAELALGALNLEDAHSLLEGTVRVVRQLPAELLTTPFADDDYPSLLVEEDAAWVCWQSFDGRRDAILLRQRDGRGWNAPVPVPGVVGDVWRPQLGRDKNGRLWVVWSEQIEGNFDLFGRALVSHDDNTRWLPEVRLTHHALPDIEPHMAGDDSGNLWLVWQGFRDRHSNIFLRFYDGLEWSEEVQISEAGANDWQPRVAVDRKGQAHVVWDSYRNGDYDVFLRTFQDGVRGPRQIIAGTPLFEAHASVAVDGAGRVWVAWDEAGSNWGKDTGPTADPMWREDRRAAWRRWVDEPSSPNARLYESRRIRLAVLEGSRRLHPGGDLQASLEVSGIEDADYPQLVIDRDTGLIALLFHGWGRRWDSSSFGSRSVFWEQAVTVFAGSSWSRSVRLPGWGRPSMVGAAAWGSGRELWVSWPVDGRQARWRAQDLNGNLQASRIRVEGRPDTLRFKPWETPEPTRVSPAHAEESAEVGRIREYRTVIAGVEHRIVRGDLHRHAEFSWDSNGGFIDGSLFDFYRYALDAAALDFGAVTDHYGGKAYGYGWWLTQKTCDMFHVPGVFLPFYGYERSLDYPLGHRNVLHARRGIPVVPFSIAPSYPGPIPRNAAGVADVTADDTRLLYEALRRTGGISIPHTTGSEMGTDWAENDPEVELLVEVFQGDRISYEHRGAPRGVGGAEDVLRGGYREDGFVWNAYAKGYRLGAIASSDHWSTHVSYAMVFAEEPTRDSVFQAMKRRHTYGATDNVVLEVRMEDAFMGDEIETSRLPVLRIRAIGTARVSRIEVIKDERIMYSAGPNREDVSLTYVDQEPVRGLQYYYVRLFQEDGQAAWGSPIWVTYTEAK